MFNFQIGSKYATIDAYTDRYSRFFMKNVCLVISAILIIQYFTTSMECTNTGRTIPRSFAQKSCWSSGLYIYEELTKNQTGLYHYGLPVRNSHDGMDSSNETCSTKSRYGEKNDDCEPMKKIYFNHYQWLPFYVGLLSIVYYLPYVVFCMNNGDVKGLGALVETEMGGKAEQIAHNYFNHLINSVILQQLKISINILVKLLYVAVNVFAYSYTGYLLNGGFGNFGDDIRNWDGGNQTQSERLTYPGFKLLPLTGMCQVTYSVSDLRTSFVQNHPNMQCIMPANILYQYALLLLWFLFVFGITISVVGFFAQVGIHLYHFLCYGNELWVRKLYSSITLRETEYLDLMKERDMVLYGNVLRKLKDIKGGTPQHQSGHNEEEHHMIDSL